MCKMTVVNDRDPDCLMSCFLFLQFYVVLHLRLLFVNKKIIKQSFTMQKNKDHDQKLWIEKCIHFLLKIFIRIFSSHYIHWIELLDISFIGMPQVIYYLFVYFSQIITHINQLFSILNSSMNPKRKKMDTHINIYSLQSN